MANPNLAVSEREVDIDTGAGHCAAAFAWPTEGTHPGVILWADIFGLRPALRLMARRLAATGFAVVAPNPFYRVGVAPDPATFDFHNPQDRAQLAPLRASIFAPGHAEQDATALADFLRAQAAVEPGRPMGVHGYCMGGALAVRTAAHLGARIGAAASFHGGGLVTDAPDSPHLLAPKITARMYFGIAQNDDAREPATKDKLRQAFAGVPTEIGVYPARHGWCMPDMPMENGEPVYDPTEADRAFDKLVELYQAGL